MLKRICKSLVIAAGCVGSLAAANHNNDWNAALALKAGTKVEIIHEGFKRADGALTAVTSDAISVSENGRETTISKSAVLRITVHGGSRAKHALVGLAIGAAASAALSAVDKGDDIRIGSWKAPKGVSVAGAAVAGGGLGAAIGAVLPASHTIYRAPAPAMAPLP